jgi:branched-subunit amino acid transport protein AzlD
MNLTRKQNILLLSSFAAGLPFLILSIITGKGAEGMGGFVGAYFWGFILALLVKLIRRGKTVNLVSITGWTALFIFLIQGVSVGIVFLYIHYYQ